MAVDLLELGVGEQLVLFGAYSYLLFSLLPTTTAIAAESATLAAIYLYLKRRWGYWKRLGVDGPSGNIVFGHTPEIISRGTDVVDLEWTKKYGKIFGTYMLAKPTLVVSDFDFLRHVLVKDFAHFTNRRKLPGTQRWDETDALVNKGLTAIDDQHWKDVRSTITPAFTTGKIKHMTSFLDDSLATLDDIISEHIESGKPIPVKDVLGCFALDVIAKSAFGMDIDAQRDKHSPFVKHATEIFSIKLTNYRIALGLMFPQLMRSLQNVFKFQLIFPEGDRFYKSALRAIIAEREKQKKPKLDFLQLLLNATKLEKSDPVEADKELVHDKAVGGKTLKLDEYDLMAQCFTFIVAGYETTSTTLQFALYLLTVHPEIQDKCYEEIASVVDETSQLTYDRLQQLTYLEKVISESLRIYTPSQRTERECNSAIDINGISIEKGVIICVPIWAIHHDPEIYPEPDKFDPERFSPENKASRDPLAYMPFGHGPRNCIGMRFAQLEMKMALAYLLHRFKFIPCAETESMPLKVRAGFSTMPAKPIFLSAVKR